jgi:hypothetical protein
MITTFTVYATISVTFSLGFAAGAWWASRARFNEGADFEGEILDRNDDPVIVRAPDGAVLYCLGQRQRPTNFT